MQVYHNLARELIRTTSFMDRRKRIHEFDYQNDKQILRELVFEVPGYSIPKIIIGYLPYSVELWEELFTKSFFANCDKTLWPEYHDFTQRKVLNDYDGYYLKLLSRVRDRDFLRYLKNKIITPNPAFKDPQTKCMTVEQAFSASNMLARRYNEIPNSIDFIMSEA